MLTVTESAGAHLNEMLSDQEEGYAIRFVPEQNGLALHLDTPKEGDEQFEHEGKTVLVLDENVAEALSDKQLEVQDTDEGRQLALS